MSDGGLPDLDDLPEEHPHKAHEEELEHGTEGDPDAPSGAEGDAEGDVNDGSGSDE